MNYKEADNVIEHLCNHRVFATNKYYMIVRMLKKLLNCTEQELDVIDDVVNEIINGHKVT
ncbi:hypothetical protein NUACC26_086530 [Scytonema sp. NUACC26]